MTRWPKSAVRKLRRLVAGGATHAECAAALGRSVSVIKSACSRYGFRMPSDYRDWTEEERDVLRREYKKTTTIPELAAKLNRTEKAVYQQAKALGLCASVPRLTEEFFDKLRDLNVAGKSDQEISVILKRQRSEISRIRRGLKIPVSKAGIHRSQLRGVESQRKTLGIRHGGDLRRLAYQRFAESRGWPPDTKPREVQILEALAVAGRPMTVREISDAIGMKPKLHASGTRYVYLTGCNNQGGTYTGSLVRKGLVLRLRKKMKMTGSRGASQDLYVLSPTALDIVINRVETNG